MKRIPSRSSVAVVAFTVSIALAIYGGLMKTQDATPPGADAAKQATPPGAGAAKGKGGGRGRAAVDTLGEGPWDLKSEKADIHVTVVTKGLDHPWGLATSAL